MDKEVSIPPGTTMETASETDRLLASANKGVIRAVTSSEKTIAKVKVGSGSIDTSKPQTTVVYHDLSYSVEIQNAFCGGFYRKQILFHLSGQFTPGMNAIMGPTGGGKTTLLDVVSQRCEPSGVNGHLLINGQKPPTDYKFMTGYVVQDDDVVVGTLTVRENLMFSANLRLPETTSEGTKKRLVNNMINELGLKSCADTKIGTDFIRGVSGGERKRTNIGMEMITSPPILFLDEPTTGLDASTAISVMALLERLSRKGRTIIFSIHQPRYAIFKLFDQLTLLASGRTVFHGPANEGLDFFHSIGYHCEEHDNPPDFFLDVINGDFTAMRRSADGDTSLQTGRGPDRKLTHHLLATSYQQSEWCNRVEETLSPVITEFKRRPQRDDSFAMMFYGYYPLSLLMQIVYVSKRLALNLIRRPQASLLQLFTSALFSLIAGAMYAKLDFSYPSGLQNRVGSLFFIAVNQMWTNISGVEVFIQERVFFVHENASGFYRVSTYFFSKVLGDFIPMRFVPLCVYALVAYFLIGYQLHWYNFMVFFVSLFVETLAGAAIVFAISASVEAFAIANISVVIIFVIMMLLGGLYINVKDLPAWLHWTQYVSIVRYCYSVLLTNELSGQIFYGKYENGTEYVVTTGDEYLTSQGIAHDTHWDMWRSTLANLAIGVGVMMFAYIQLRRMKKLK